MGKFDRGFKSWSERCAVNLRQELGIKRFDPLPAESVASYLDIELLTPVDVPGMHTQWLDQLLVKDRDGWSAVTICQGEHRTIIYNPRHSIGRRSSDIVHELAHVIIGHKQSTLVMSPDGSVVMRTFNEKQEDEANWLCGCLLLPRDVLLYTKRGKLPEDEICERYRVAVAMLRYRLRVTGVDRQLASTFRKLTAI